MILTLFAYWGIGLPVGYALGLTDWLGAASGPSGLWQGLDRRLELRGADAVDPPDPQCTQADSPQPLGRLISENCRSELAREGRER
jgi:hypothetical protein